MKKQKLWLPSIFSDNMMLQEGKENLIWGRAGSGCPITVTLAKKKVKGKAGKKGLFKILLPALGPGGPYTMTVNAGQKRIIKNVLIGDVWVCSGQSNMAMIVKDCNNSAKEIGEAKYPKMRIFSVPKIYSLNPFFDVKGKWEEVAPYSAGKFSAAGYFFGRKLHSCLNKPIGLIDTSYGGTKIEWWMSEDAIKSWKGFPELKKHTRALIKKIKKTGKKKQIPVNELHTDTGAEGLRLGYEKGDYDAKEWKTIKAPGYWNGQGLDFVGAVWLKKDVNIPESWMQYDLALDLGAIVDFDSTYFNDEKIGSVGSDIPNFWAYSRRYLIQARLVKPGKNNITVRVFAANRVGGFGAEKGVMMISVINHPELGRIKIEGKWRYKVERELPSLGMAEGVGVEERTYGTLYNAMVFPLVGFGVKGFIWYQGESNADKPKEYFELKKLFIADLRRKWKDNELPFYFVQLANYGKTADDWAALRAAQQEALKLPNTGMAVAIDIGETSDIHPKNKQDVGERLALNALALTYGKNIEYSGPVYKSMEIEGKKIRILFKHSGSGLKAGNNKFLTGFEISGKNGNFVSAKAKIDKKSVVVWNGGVKKPAAVRYAWANDPKCSLYNKAGLPAVPFKAKCI
ncbi:MAG: sialate O-acetylesterase [Candidatus Firestonebacteria bacterium]